MAIRRYKGTRTFGPHSPVSGIIMPAELLFVSSQAPYDAEADQMYDGPDVATHTRLSMDGLVRALNLAGVGPEDVLRVTAVAALPDPVADRGILNEVYKSYFDPHYLPSRSFWSLPFTGAVSVSFDAIAARQL